MYMFVDICMYVFVFICLEITLYLTRRHHYNIACTLAPKKKDEYWKEKN